MNRQMRMACAFCGAQWWHTPGSLIHPMDHARPDGRNCAASRSNLAGKVIATKTQKELVMEAWDRLYGPEDRAERRKKLWEKEEVNRKARSRL